MRILIEKKERKKENFNITKIIFFIFVTPIVFTYSYNYLCKYSFLKTKNFLNDISILNKFLFLL